MGSKNDIILTTTKVFNRKKNRAAGQLVNFKNHQSPTNSTKGPSVQLVIYKNHQSSTNLQILKTTKVFSSRFVDRKQ